MMFIDESKLKFDFISCIEINILSISLYTMHTNFWGDAPRKGNISKIKHFEIYRMLSNRKSIQPELKSLALFKSFTSSLTDIYKFSKTSGSKCWPNACMCVIRCTRYANPNRFLTLFFNYNLNELKIRQYFQQ